MNKRKLALTFGVCAAFLLASCGGSESGAKTKNAALPKAPAVTAQGSCDDNQMTEGEDDDDCTLVVKLGSTSRKATLETLNTDGGWDSVDSVIAKKGNAKFDLAATDEDGMWLDGEYTFRVHALKSGKSPEVISQEFDIMFTSSAAADDSAAMDEGDSGSSPEMQKAMDDIDNPSTKFDDFCSKQFSKADCALMFRPNQGPDFKTLGKDKWVKMCSTLLKRPAADCEMEFQFATNRANGTAGGNGTGMTGGNGQGMPQGQGLDPVKLASACAAIGMAEADCRAAIAAGPMVALQKFADKAETFCKAYGGTSCAELIAKFGAQGGNTQMPPQGGNGQQPMQGGNGTQQPMNGGNTMQQPSTGGAPQQQSTGGNGPSNDAVKSACATAGVSDADCSKLVAANSAGSTTKPRDVIMSWGADKAEKFCQAIAKRSCAEVLK